MAYLEFEADAELELEFAVAEKVGMTVAALRADMSNREFVQWGIYLARKGQRRQLGQ